MTAPKPIELWPSTLEVIDRGLSDIQARYGADSEAPQDFHNEVHAREVLGNGLVLCLARKAPPGLQNATAVAAVFHDYVHGHGSGESENASAEAAVAIMRETRGFSGKFQDRVSRMIIATTVSFKEGKFIQSATEKDEMILADADMSNIGSPTPYYRQRGLRLFRERYPGEPEDGEAMSEFLIKSEPVLRTHRYYLPESQNLFPYQTQNMLFTQALSRALNKNQAA